MIISDLDFVNDTKLQSITGGSSTTTEVTVSNGYLTDIVQQQGVQNLDDLPVRSIQIDLGSLDNLLVVIL